MKIQIAGPGCAKCQAMEKNVREVCQMLGISPEIEHAYDTREFAKLGVRFTPALVIDGKVIVSGKVPTIDEIKKILQS
jgi:small redox-active disulfide protein 2